MMTDDVVFMVPGQEPFGKEAFASASENLKDVAFEIASDIREIQMIGAWAYLRSHIRMTITPRDGGATVKRAGYTLTILRNGAGGKWRISRDANLLATES